MATDLIEQAGKFESAAGQAVAQMGGSEQEVNNAFGVINNVIMKIRNSINTDRSRLTSLENYGQEGDMRQAALIRQSMTVKENFLRQAQNGDFSGLVRFFEKAKRPGI